MNVTRKKIETPAQLLTLKEFLRANQLPTEDIDIERGHFFVYFANENLVGAAALEKYGSVALLRSVCVSESSRKTGVGSYLVADMQALARNLLHANELYLLTETASVFFQRHGFVQVARADVPFEIKTSIEFANVCPTSATVMKLSVS